MRRAIAGAIIAGVIASGGYMMHLAGGLHILLIAIAVSIPLAWAIEVFTE